MTETNEFQTIKINNFDVIMHQKTKFYNAAKICSNNGKKFGHLRSIKAFNYEIERISNKLHIPKDKLLLDLNKGFNNSVKGTYIHPKLFNFVFSWATNAKTTRIKTTNFNEIIEYEGEKFIRTSYRGISFITDGNGFYNASKICRDHGTNFKTITRNNYWQQYIRRLMEIYKLTLDDLIHERKYLGGKLKGVYIHRRLINFLYFHLNIDYAISICDVS